nr:RNA-directed DNA polymerase, eukaryota, reverse transcriptase zinc-binding domain protein [Tanacetum cinerariifolium]
MGFSFKWRNWIHSCLNSAFALVCVNWSPTKEIKLKRGLRQGDPLSPFLFILAVEALNIAILKATNNIFHGIQKGEFQQKQAIRSWRAKLPRCHNWKPLVDRFHKRLSKWKSKSLSFGSHLTLVRSVLGSLGVYYFSNFKAPKKVICKLESIRRQFFWGGCSDEKKISWIAWDKVISPRVKGGLSIGSLSACNQAMLSKCPNGGLHENSSLMPNSGPCLSIEEDSWEFTVGTTRKLSVKDMRSHITSLSQPGTSQPTRWNNSIPSKVNINTWRAMNSRLPTRTNLELRGMDLESVRCAVCDEEIETEEHVFVHCKIAVDIWKDIFKWWKIPILHLNNLSDVVHLADQDLIAAKHTRFLDALVQTTIWSCGSLGMR